MLCLTLDIFKGLGSVLAASLLADVYSPLFILVVIAPIFGHALGLFNRFHGGKCIATSFGVTAGLLPVSFVPFTLLALLYIFFAAILNIKPHKVCSIIVYSLFAVASLVILCVQGYVSAGMGCLGIGIIAVIKHLDLFQEERVKKEEEDYEEQF
jgi:glycerol-3-phosphate acyltransferase PlsY